MDDLLAGYGSSSSSSSTPSVADRPYRPSSARHDGLLPHSGHDALPGHPPDPPPRAGGRGHGPAGEARADGRVGGATDVEGGYGVERNKGQIEKGADEEYGAGANDRMVHVAKRRRLEPSPPVDEECKRAVPVIIAGYGDAPASDAHHVFERSHPHWEGRWVGHVHLPLPVLESLDAREEDGAANAAGDQTSASEKMDEMVREKGGASESSGSSSGEDSSDDEEEITQQNSRLFLPAARRLIHYWARIIEGCASFESRILCGGGSNGSVEDLDQNEGQQNSTITLVPHIPMQSSTKPPSGESSPTPPLHISLARPIYLPAPSVDPFLSDLERSIRAVLSLANGNAHAKPQTGRTLLLQPRHAKVFTNDQGTRSFLAVPVSHESARWAKRSLVPSIDAAMVRFGLETYYGTEEGGCTLHVSVASVRGNVIPWMLRQRGGHGNEGKDLNEIRSLSLFRQEDESSSAFWGSLPRSIPMKVERVECEFGRAKRLTIPL